jgi:hypothetical protein
MHVETPTHTGQHVRASDVPSVQAINGGLLTAIHNPADTPIYIDTIQAAIFQAGIFSSHLIIGL